MDKKTRNLNTYHKPLDFSDYFARYSCNVFRWVADTIFKKRYAHRAIVLETIAAIPGMVGAMLTHLKCLRRQCIDNGWIKALIDEAENERMHLMSFIEVAKINRFEGAIILVSQIGFFIFFFFLYIISPKTAHRLVGYFEEEAIISYTLYLEEIEKGRIENISAPQIAIDYWQLGSNATLRDLVIAVRQDEANHRDVNHQFSDETIGKS